MTGRASIALQSDALAVLLGLARLFAITATHGKGHRAKPRRCDDFTAVDTVSVRLSSYQSTPSSNGPAFSPIVQLTKAMVVGNLQDRSLKGASINRLTCLVRHWTWADDAMARFERELAGGWEYHDDPRADHLFGAYHHWCALLCGFSEAALDHGFLPASPLESLRSDLEACLPELRACRQLLVVIPASREEHPRIVDLLRDEESLGRLRRVHYAFGRSASRGAALPGSRPHRRWSALIGVRGPATRGAPQSSRSEHDGSVVAYQDGLNRWAEPAFTFASQFVN